MAAAVLVFTPVDGVGGEKQHPFGDALALLGTISYTGADYATGGTAHDFGLRFKRTGAGKVYGVFGVASNGASLLWDDANGKVKLMNGTAELANATDLTNVTALALVIGR